MVDEMFSLEGRVAIVTGSGTGIGRATAQVLAEHGADLVLAARRAELLEQTAASIRDLGRHTLVVPTDVTDSEACERLVAATLEEYGHVDVLVNNTGGGISKSPEKWTVAEWHQVIDLNLASVWFMSRWWRPRCSSRAARDLNIWSGASFLALPMHAPYGAAKAGMNSLTLSRAAAWTGGGVRVKRGRVWRGQDQGYNRSTTRQQQPDDVVVGPAAEWARRPTRRDRVSGAVPRVGCVELLLGPDALGERRSEGSGDEFSWALRAPTDSGTVRRMEQRMSLITLGVGDLGKSKAFYEQLGWQGQEAEETIFYQAGGQAVVLWDRASSPPTAGSTTTGVHVQRHRPRAQRRVA